MITIKGSIPEKTLKLFQALPPIGCPGEGTTDISIDTPNFNGNRTPKGAVLAKYLQKMGGFHWGLFGSPLVARLPDGSLQIYDGGHRVAMLQQVYPDMKTFPGTIVPVESKAEISRLFHRVNGSAASFVTAETRFINEVKGEEEGIDKYTDVLTKANVCVFDSETNFVPENIKPTWKINVGPLQDMVDSNSEHAIWALNRYTEAWHNTWVTNSSVGIPITGQIVKALFTIRSLYNDYFQTPENERNFINWFNSNVDLNPDKGSWMFGELKHDRMELRHYGTAYGIFTKYCSYARNKYKNKAPKIDRIKNLYEDYDQRKSKNNSTIEEALEVA